MNKVRKAQKPTPKPKHPAPATTPDERIIREVPRQLPKADQWSGLLIRIAKKDDEKERIFFFPSRVLSAYELVQDDQGLQFGDLISALSSMPSCNMGVKNAILVNNMDTIVPAGMRIIDIVKSGAIGNYWELWPERTDWRRKPAAANKNKKK